jgi:hypothetical protein
MRFIFELAQDNLVSGIFKNPDELANLVSVTLKKLTEISHKPTTYYDLRGANINNLAHSVQGNLVTASTISDNTFIGTQNNYSSRTPQELWQEKLQYLQVQQAITADPSIKFQLEHQIQECQEKIAELSSTSPREVVTAPVTKSSDIILTGELRKQIRKTILYAYPFSESLAMVLSENLDINLDSIKRGDNYALTVFNLIRDMEAQGRLGELLRALMRGNPTNQALKDVYNMIA